VLDAVDRDTLRRMGPAIGVLVLVMFLIVIVAVAMRGSYEGTLKSLGQPYGLAYERHRDGFGVGVGHSLKGYLDGRPFLLIVAPGNGGVLEEAWTLSLAGQLPHGFAAGKNGWLRSADQGTVRVQSGDAELDKLVFVQAIDAQGAWHVFGDARRRTALMAQQRGEAEGAARGDPRDRAGDRSGAAAAVSAAAAGLSAPAVSGSVPAYFVTVTTVRAVRPRSGSTSAACRSAVRRAPWRRRRRAWGSRPRSRRVADPRARPTCGRRRR
jgi:hypothetical protein